MVDFFQILINGIVLGGIYTLCGIGMILIFKATNVVSIVQGELMTISAFAYFSFSWMLGFSTGISIILAIIAVVPVCLLIERFVLRPLIGAEIWASILATAALMVVIQAAIRVTWGPEQFSVPPILSRNPMNIIGMRITREEIMIIGVCVIYIVLFFLFFQFTKIGKAMRAVQLDKEAASLMGINVKSVYSYVWIMNGVLMGTVGILLAPMLGVSSTMGAIGLKGFVVAIVGGFTSFGGAIIGGIFLGIIETLAGLYVSTALKDIVSFAILIFILLFRPTGIIPESVTKRV